MVKKDTDEIIKAVTSEIVNSLDNSAYSKQANDIQNEFINAKMQLNELFITIKALLEDDKENAKTLKSVVERQTKIIIKLNELTLKIELIKERMEKYIRACDKRVIRLVNTILSNKTQINNLLNTTVKVNLEYKHKNNKTFLNLSLSDRILILENELVKDRKDKNELKKSLNELVKKHNELLNYMKKKEKNYTKKLIRFVKAPFIEVWNAVIKSLLIKILISILIGMGLFSQFEEIIKLILEDLY